MSHFPTRQQAAAPAPIAQPIAASPPAASVTVVPVAEQVVVALAIDYITVQITAASVAAPAPLNVQIHAPMPRFLD